MQQNETPSLVQPNRFNAAEAQLAIAIDEIRSGQSIFTSHGEDLKETCEAIRGGLLEKMRGAFRENVLAVVVPMFEQFEPVELPTKDQELKAFLKEMRKEQARSLVSALREAALTIGPSEVETEEEAPTPENMSNAETALNHYLEGAIRLDEMCSTLEKCGMRREAATFRTTTYRFFVAGDDGYIRSKWGAPQPKEESGRW